MTPFYSIFFLIFVLTSCAPKVSYKIQLVNKVMSAYTNEMCGREEMSVAGDGGAMMDEIEKFFVSYVTPRHVAISEARCIAVKAIDSLSALVNQNKEIRPFLDEFPFPPSGTDLIIQFSYQNRPENTKGYIEIVYIENGQITYEDFDIKFTDTHGRYKETYEEAVTKLRSDL